MHITLILSILLEEAKLPVCVGWDGHLHLEAPGLDTNLYDGRVHGVISHLEANPSVQLNTDLQREVENFIDKTNDTLAGLQYLTLHKTMDDGIEKYEREMAALRQKDGDLMTSGRAAILAENACWRSRDSGNLQNKRPPQYSRHLLSLHFTKPFPSLWCQLRFDMGQWENPNPSTPANIQPGASYVAGRSSGQSTPRQINFRSDEELPWPSWYTRSTGACRGTHLHLLHGWRERSLIPLTLVTLHV